MRLGNIFASKPGGQVPCLYEWIGPEATLRRDHPAEQGRQKNTAKSIWGVLFFEGERQGTVETPVALGPPGGVLVQRPRSRRGRPDAGQKPKTIQG
jgi:hypothetical protein